MKKKIPIKSVDYPLLGLVLVLLLCGLAMLYSASTVISYKNFGNTSYYFVHQLLYGALIGLAAMYICSRLDYHFWKKVVLLLVGGSLVALCLVKVPGLGFSSGGATRWVHVGPIFFQPAELAKLALLIYAASWMASRDWLKAKFTADVLPPLIITAVFAMLILWQPDMGSTLSMVGTVAIIMFAGGLPMRYFLWCAGAAVAAVIGLIALEPYRMNRITAFFNRSVDPLGIGYQINQALLAIGGGGLWGHGYGFSRQKFNYLPEAIGDSIFAVMAEELGFIRVMLILGVFALFTLRGLKIAKRAPDTFGQLLAIGIVGSIMVQTLTNIGAIMGLLPLTGIPLPFFSYGSSSMIIVLAEIGILLNISRYAR